MRCQAIRIPLSKRGRRKLGSAFLLAGVSAIRGRDTVRSNAPRLRALGSRVHLPCTAPSVKRGRADPTMLDVGIVPNYRLSQLRSGFSPCTQSWPESRMCCPSRAWSRVLPKLSAARSGVRSITSPFTATNPEQSSISSARRPTSCLRMGLLPSAQLPAGRYLRSRSTRAMVFGRQIRTRDWRSMLARVCD